MENLFHERLKVVVGSDSVRSFGKKCGVSESVLRKYLKGTSEPGLENLIKIAKAGNVKVGWLAAGEGTPQQAPQEQTGTILSPQDQSQDETDIEIEAFLSKNLRRFYILFKYIIEEFGTGSTDIEDWFDDYRKMDKRYQHWRHQDRVKKEQRLNDDDGSPEGISVNS